MYLHIDVKEPRETAFWRVLIQSLDDDAGWSILSSGHREANSLML